jgi:RNA polymerase sigma-70 factor (ECF subfamily)
VTTTLETALAAIRARWPAGPEPDAAVTQRIEARPERAEDLYLAWWCRDGEAAGIAAFEAAFHDDLRITTSRFRDLPADELRQQLRIKLFVGTGDTPPRIRDYAGKGSLKAWLRVTAVRCFVDIMRSTHRERSEQELEESDVLGLSDPHGADGSMRAEIAAAVKSAFAAAVKQLTPRQRVFLRHAYVDHHTLDQIASHYAVHRTTVARVLGAARQQLIDDTRALVIKSIGLAGEELASVIRVLDSRIDLSLSRVFDATR